MATSGDPPIGWVAGQPANQVDNQIDFHPVAQTYTITTTGNSSNITLPLIWNSPTTQILPNTGVIPNTTIGPGIIGPGSIQPYVWNATKIFKKMRISRLSSPWERLKKLALSALDKKWMINFGKDQKEAQKEIPPTVLRKLLAKGLLEIKLTERGRQEAIAYAMIGPDPR